MNFPRTITLVWLSAVLSGSFAQAESQDLPSLGDTSSSLISPRLEREIGRDFVKQIHASLPTISDPILKYYVEHQLASLVSYSQLKEKVLSTILIDNPDINAFAAPGGVVGINLGLILAAHDVHEYSSVIGHELAHLSQRHFARGIEEQRSATLPGIAAMIAAIAIGALGGADAGLAAISSAQALALDQRLRYSRSREQEADRIGLSTLAQAGLDPQGMSRMFARMDRTYRFTRRPPEFLMTHPLTDSRVADARNQALAYQEPGRVYDQSPDYQMMRARAIVHYSDTPDAAVKLFRKQLETDPDDIGAEYGLAYALSKSGEHMQSVALAESLHSANRHKILFIATYAEALIAADLADQAIKLLAHELVINPDNAPMSMLYAEALVAEGEFEQAENVLQRQSEVRRDDVDVWYELAEVSGQAGDILGVHLARAEFFALHGDYQRAIQHLEYAHRLASRTDTMLQAKLDQRIIDLKTMIRERQG